MAQLSTKLANHDLRVKYARFPNIRKAAMKIELENLGVLRQASFTLNDLTIICGENNTGKTYAAYSLFGFLNIWKRHLYTEGLKDLHKPINALLKDGVTHIDLEPFLISANHILERICSSYAKELPDIFAAKSNQFQNSKFQVQFDEAEFSIGREFHREFFTSEEDKVFSADKQKNSNELTISLLIDKTGKELLPRHVIHGFVSNCIGELLFKPLLPSPFIASVERTGATIFRKELNFARNRLLEEMMNAGEDIDPMELLFKSYKDYPLPVKVSVDFARNLQTIAKEKSHIFKNHPEILTEFADILGGEYAVGKDDAILYRPNRNSVGLEMDESSSSVRSLLDLGFYLRHKAQLGDLLLIDEPELNLHPKNQCRIARLFVRLVNLGIKVFITTHSDYILKELNTSIMLNGETGHLKSIAKKYSYRSDELLDFERVNVYIAETGLIQLRGNSKRSRWPTLVAAHIDNQVGISARSFDSVIDRMNEIQQEIIWGRD